MVHSLNQILESLTEEDKLALQELSPAERDLVLRSLADHSVRAALTAADYKIPPVSPREFFSSTYYIGDRVWNDETSTGLYPLWLDELCYVLDPSNKVYEWILSGSLGAGKTTAALLCLMYWLYKLTCLRDPHRYLGLMANESIDFFFFNVTLYAVEDNALGRFENFVNTSPYFREIFPEDRRRKAKSVQRFGGLEKEYKLSYPPYFSVIGGTGTQHQIGRNIVCSMLDEANFAQRSVKDGARFRYDALSKAYQMYTSLKNRIESRFLSDGQVIGLLLLISSAGSSYDFLEQHKSKVRHDPHVHISEFSRWEVSPWKYSSKTFPVFVGGKTSNSRVLKDGEEVPSGGKVIHVPLDFRRSFEQDLPLALKDVAGIPSDVSSPLLPIREQILDTIDPTRKHPFSEVAPVIGHLSSNLDALAKLLLPEELAVWSGGILVPKHYRSALRHVHVDLGLTEDSAGLAMGCISGLKTGRVEDSEGRYTNAMAPVVWMDFMLRIDPPQKPEQISIESIHYLLRYLRDVLHFHFGSITFDGFQSASVIQLLQNEFMAKTSRSSREYAPMTTGDGYPQVKVLSVDKKPEPYKALRMTIMENRMVRYAYEPFDSEVGLLQVDLTSGKVDHLPGLCFVGETRIPLLDGTCPEIKDLVGRDVWVYSTDSSGKAVPARAFGLLSGYAQDFVDVELDTGAVVRCTPTHPWRLRNGDYKQAKDLRPGVDRLMPVTREWPKNGGYEFIGDVTGVRMPTHRMVYSNLYGDIPEGFVVHHVNHVKTDNSPGNLVLVAKADHSKHHADLRHANDSGGYRRALSEGTRRFNTSTRGRELHSQHLKLLNASTSREEWLRRARIRESFRSDITIDSLLSVVTDPEATNANAVSKILGCGRNVVIRVLRESGYASWAEFSGNREPITRSRSGNHRVRAVHPVHLSVAVPIYDLTVPEYDNFVLPCGAVVHNSKDVSDAVAGVVYHCHDQLRRYGNHDILEALAKPSDPREAVKRLPVVPVVGSVQEDDMIGGDYKIW